jgi:acyl carrier protein
MLSLSLGVFKEGGAMSGILQDQAVESFRLRRDDLALNNPFVSPADEVEAGIATDFASILELDRVGAEDDFYDLGGDSMAALQIALALSERFAFPFNAGLLGEHRSPRALAPHIRQRATGA